MNLLDGARVLPFGETAVVLEFGDRIDPWVHDRALALDEAVRVAGLEGVEEVVPSYRSILVRLDPLVTTPDDAVAAIAGLASESTLARTPREVEVGVDFEAGEDLPGVAQRTGLSVAEVVAGLTSGPLRVYLHGFAPGFAYLGGVPAALHVPRRATPRAPVPAGSVLLAAGQAALCPVSMPTGWWVVGRTDADLFDPEADPPVPFEPGDSVQLVAAP